MLLVLLPLFAPALVASSNCTGLEPNQCTALNTFLTDAGFKLAEHNCDATDPCACKPGGYSGNGITCANGAVTSIVFSGEFHADIKRSAKPSSYSLSLTGTISSAIGTLTSLQTLDVSGNELRGTLPEELGHLTDLSSLTVGVNHLSGSLPNSLTKLTKLGTNNGEFSLYCNQFNGAVPALDFAKMIASGGCALDESENFCSSYCTPTANFTNNNFACPLPAGAVDDCNAACA
jgi:hypothetical protein